MKIRKLLFLFCCLCLFSSVRAQQDFSSNDAKTFFVRAGYNRSVYTRPNVQLNGSNYNATLHDVQLSDNKEGVPLNDFFSTTSPQFNIGIGYYIADKWAITAGFDRYNTFFVYPQKVGLTGTFAPGTNLSYSGEVQETIPLKRDAFNLIQKHGVSFLSLGIQRADQLYRSRRGTFAVQLVYGLKVGALLTKVDYTYNHTTIEDISSFSGIGVAAYFNLHFDIAQYIFLELGAEGGLLNQNKIKIANGGGKNQYAKQVVGYLSPHLNIGFSIPFTGNGCGTCPSW